MPLEQTVSGPGEALDASPEQVELRVAKYKDGVVIDLGDPSGRAVVVVPGKWELVDRSPVIFRRTPMTAPLPEPMHIEGQRDLRSFLNVTDESWPLVWGWMIAAFMPSIPHPPGFLGGHAFQQLSCRPLPPSVFMNQFYNCRTYGGILCHIACYYSYLFLVKIEESIVHIVHIVQRCKNFCEVSHPRLVRKIHLRQSGEDLGKFIQHLSEHMWMRSLILLF